MITTLVILTGLGLTFGSFINALVWRTHEHEKGENLSIWNGRSQCVHCGHELAAKDLIPVFSWLSLRGKCRYCGLPISVQYPFVELATAVWFLMSYYFWPGGVFGVGEWLLLITWLAASVGLLSLAIYDFRWGLLPSKLIYPTFLIAAAGRLAYTLSFEPAKLKALLLWLLSIGVASGLFWLLYQASQGEWIGYGDVRLGLVSGTVLATPGRSLLMIFTASVLGTIIMLPALATGRKQLASKLPFGPFLIAATALVLLFGDSLINRYKQLFLN